GRKVLLFLSLQEAARIPNLSKKLRQRWSFFADIPSAISFMTQWLPIHSSATKENEMDEDNEDEDEDKFESNEDVNNLFSANIEEDEEENETSDEDSEDGDNWEGEEEDDNENLRGADVIFLAALIRMKGWRIFVDKLRLQCNNVTSDWRHIHPFGDSCRLHDGKVRELDALTPDVPNDRDVHEFLCISNALHPTLLHANSETLEWLQRRTVFGSRTTPFLDILAQIADLMAIFDLDQEGTQNLHYAIDYYFCEMAYQSNSLKRDPQAPPLRLEKFTPHIEAIDFALAHPSLEIDACQCRFEILQSAMTRIGMKKSKSELTGNTFFWILVRRTAGPKSYRSRGIHRIVHTKKDSMMKARLPKELLEAIQYEIRSMEAAALSHSYALLG
ncbi:hypothetical protein BC829DRAFT_404194, partial [Chytridium lagenaria]